jgi:alpha-methylacyl-CoA racemase
MTENALLSGIRVIDLTRLVPGPFASMLLADLGADVIKVEHPEGGDPERASAPQEPGRPSYRFGMLNRSKRSIVIDLKSPEGSELLARLAEGCDVLIEGFRPGVMARLGLGNEELRRRNPRLVYCSLSGYGQNGPLAALPGHDVNYLAVAGLLQHFVADGENHLPWLPLSDLGGALTAVSAILAALVARGRTGSGEYLDIAMADCSLYWLQTRAQWWLSTGQDADPESSYLSGAWPGYGVYRTRDGKLISLGALEPAFWVRLCEALGLPQYRDAQRDVGLREDIQQAIRSALQTRDRDDWQARFTNADVPAAPVLGVGEALTHENFRARGRSGEGASHQRILAPFDPVVSSPATPGPAPGLGEHTDAILAEMGVPADEIARLRNAGTIK